MKKQLVAFVSLLLSASFSCAETAAKLKVGDKAPSLSIHQWLKGDPITEFSRGHTYVVEFTSVNCVPCRTIAPHLTQLAEQYKGKATILGVHILENDPRKADDLGYVESVRRYLAQMGRQIGFSVAVDVPAQTTMKEWMSAAGRNSVPTTFVIDQHGRIAWIGSPAQIDPILAAVVVGTFDPVTYARQQEELQKQKQAALIKPGSAAPTLSISKWMRGKPITSYEAGQIYAIALIQNRHYNTCRKALYILDDVAKKYGNELKMIAVFSDSDSQAEAEVERYVNAFDNKLNFTLAIDTPDRKTLNSWVESTGSGRGALLRIFLVDGSGRYIWNGEAVYLDAVVAGAIQGKGIEAGIAQNELHKAIWADIQKASDISRTEGGLKEAIRLLDGIIKVHPEQDAAYMFKYSTLARSGPEGEVAAKVWMQWMLDHVRPQYIYWEDLISDATVYHPNPDYDVAIKIAERAYQEAETTDALLGIALRTAAIYAMDKPGKNDPVRAMETVKGALNHPKIAASESASGVLTPYLYLYEFASLASHDDAKADAYLKKLYADRPPAMDWHALIQYSTELQKSPDYELLLDIADVYYEREARNEDPNQRLMMVANATIARAGIYETQGDEGNAMKSYETALRYARESKDDDMIGFFEGVLNKYKERRSATN